LRFDNADEYIYVFNHIPKCGGTAVRNVLAEWYPIVADYRKGFGEKETLDHIETKLDLNRIRRPAIVCGHFGHRGARLHERYPEVFENPRYRLITFMRDPLETAISSYFYSKKLGLIVAAPDLDTYLTHYRSNFAGVLNCPEGDYERGLAAYWYVGVTERLSESVDLLSLMLNKPYIEPLDLNSTLRSEAPSDDAVRLFRENNGLDYQIYAAACERLNVECSRTQI